MEKEKGLNFGVEHMTPEQVRYIKRVRNSACPHCGGRPSLKQLAHAVGYSLNAVARVARGEAYKDMTDD